jgi:MFS family permease
MIINFLKDRPRLIFLGLITNFLSGFGQSYFLSLFTPYLLNKLELSNSAYGLIYSSATLMSGLLIPYYGGRLNYESPKNFILLSFLGLAVFSLSFSFVNNPLHLWITIFGLRFFGQGMFCHISATIISSKFTLNRGKALSISNLGFPASEATLPLFMVWMTSYIEVPQIWIVISMAVMTFSFLVPILLNGSDNEQPSGKTELKIQFLQFKGIKSLTFWYYAAPGVLPAFIFTALFLYQGVILESRNLPFSLVAQALVLFALGRLFSSLISGALVDRFGSKRLFPIYLAPLTIGLILLVVIKNEFSFLLCLALGGLSQGAASTIMNSVWVEVYGPQSLAKVRSKMASLAVMGTAAGPFVFGLTIDYLFGIEGSLIMLAVIQLLVFIISFLLKKKFQQSDP